MNSSPRLVDAAPCATAERTQLPQKQKLTVPLYRGVYVTIPSPFFLRPGPGIRRNLSHSIPIKSKLLPVMRRCKGTHAHASAISENEEEEEEEEANIQRNAVRDDEIFLALKKCVKVLDI